MSNETIVTVVGNLTADPELRYTQSGIAVANLTIASTPKQWDKQQSKMVDGEPLFLRASVWREFAENVTQSLTKGSRIIAQGRLKQRQFETQAGEKRTVIELEIDEIGPDLRFATAQVTRTTGSRGGSSSPQAGANVPNGFTGTAAPFVQQGAAQPASDGIGDVWGAPGTSYNDETPF